MSRPIKDGTGERICMYIPRKLYEEMREAMRVSGETSVGIFIKEAINERIEKIADNAALAQLSIDDLFSDSMEAFDSMLASAEKLIGNRRRYNGKES